MPSVIIAFQLLIAFVFVGPALLISVYHLSLLVLRLFGARAYVLESERATNTFAIVIPAHNEQESLQETLDSCRHLEYPSEKYEVFVIADNCSDSTAQAARENGVTCLERHDPAHPGKGQALQWGFEQALKQPFNAVVVLDADCRIDPKALRVFDRCLADGSHVLQSNHVTANCDDSPPSYVARVGQYLEYDFAYAPKSCLHLAVPLVGTGMVFHRSILERHPWTAGSVVEDIEYTLRLAQSGVRVRFVANAAVRHDSEARLDQLQVQRSRWAKGTLRFSRGKGLKLLLSGLAKGRPLIADLGWTLITMSRPLILLHLAITVALAGLTAWVLSDRTSDLLLAVAAVAFLGQITYYCLGVAMLGITWHRACLLASAPVVVARLVLISFSSLFSIREPKWERTPR